MMLPPRPRLRASFWFEGDTAKCELVLMTDRRELVHRETLPVEPGSGLERVHAGLLSAAARLAHARQFAADAGGAVEASPVSAPPPPSLEQLEQRQEERRRRGEQQSAEATELADQLAKGFEQFEQAQQQHASEAEQRAAVEQLEHQAAELERRAAAQVASGSSVELLLEPEPETKPEPEKPSPDAIEAERERRRRAGAYVENRAPAPPSDPPESDQS